MPKYKFTEIAINSTEKKKPTEADKDTYVGLEHLDSGTLTVSRWGAEVAPIGEKLVMKLHAALHSCTTMNENGVQ